MTVLGVLSIAACTDTVPPPIAPKDPNDVDGDGIANAADLCPETYDPEQHDEDLDGVGDACDVCPTVFDPDQSDLGETGALQFGDHIGDACDPRPGRDGDRLALLDTFAVDTSASWEGTGWQIGADVARTDVPARWFYPGPISGDGLYGQIAVPLLVWLSGGEVEVVVDGDGESSGLSCAVVTDTDGDGHDELVARDVGVSEMRVPLPGPATAPLTITAWRTIDYTRAGHFTCRAAGLEIKFDVTDVVPAGGVAFAASGALVDVSSIVAYTFPINPCAFVAGRPQCN